jgi:hypothetical protein
MAKTRKKIRRTRTKCHKKSSGNDHGGSQITEHRKISFRELAKHPDLMIDRKRLRLAIKAADVKKLLAGQYEGGKPF